MSELPKLTQLITEYIEKRAEDRFEKLDKEAAKQLDNSDPDERAVLEQKLATQREEEQARFAPANWLTDAASRASQLQFATHGIKYIHSDAKGTNLTASASSPSLGYISTASIADPPFDVVGNAAALDVGRLLLLQHEDKSLASYIREGDYSPLRPLAESESQAKEWLQGLQKVFSAQELSSHKLGKQVYWQVNGNKYHLLVPLFQSSLAHRVYENVQYYRYSDDAKQATEARSKKRYSDHPVRHFTDMACQNFGGSNKQNVGLLNSQRGGRVYLFSSAPPTWISQISPPLKTTSIFTRQLERSVYGQVNRLRKYLEKVLHRSSTVDVRELREKSLEQITEAVIMQGAKIQQLSAGWSAHQDCKLPQEERLWLDPGRAKNDEEFAKQREITDWHTAVANNFARWLTSKLETKKMAMGLAEHNEIRDMIKDELRLNLKNLEEVVL